VTSDDGRPSKTQRKKQVTELQELGGELAKLNDDQLAAIDLPERLRDAVLEAQRIGSFEARRRQMQYIGKLMRKVDAAPIRAALETLKAGPRRETALHKRADSWRERLLADANSIHALLADYPAADAQQLQALVRDTLSERKSGRPPRAFRNLYHALHALLNKK